MEDEFIVSLIGGDKRIEEAARIISDKGYKVVSWGNGIQSADTWRSAIMGSRAVILPLPVTKDGVHINCAEDAPTITDIVDNADERCIIIGGKIPDQLYEEAAKRRIMVVDYCLGEEFAIKNSLPTAEGAIQIAMGELETTLNGSNALIVGYGRIGKTLSRLLLSLGVEVTVAARQERDLFSSELCGCKTVRIYNGETLDITGRQYDVIYNTAPVRLIDEGVLRKLKKDTVIIDLASAPGGVDRDAADKYGIKTIWALALPGKYAPVDAGRIIGECILKILDKEGKMI